MPMLSILLIALSLAMDAFAVSITSGVTIQRVKVRQALLIAFFFGLFQAVMPVLGWAAGQWLVRWIEMVDHWIAFALLLYVGGHMIIQALHIEDDPDDIQNPLHIPTLFMLAIATSIDAFAIGISLSMIRVSILMPVLIIGAVTFVLSFAGVYFGRLFGHLNEKKLEIAGGVILIGIGIKILIEHLIEHEVLFHLTPKLWIAFAFTMTAGLATGIGSLRFLFKRRTRARRSAFLAGVASGLLLWIAFRYLLPPDSTGQAPSIPALILFFGGLILMAWIDRQVPAFGNPHEPLRIENVDPNPSFRRTGMPTALGIAAHSFPEGFALFITALHTPLPIALGATLALALHNIPEGIATVLPMYHATGSRTKACGFSALTGLAEPLGAILAYTLLHPFLDASTIGLPAAAAGGVFVFIALDSLLPAVKAYGKTHHAVYGVCTGMLLAQGLTLLIQ
jgi:ZIP family zinc transporter